MTDKLMYSCPKWESCSAPICPLDTRWRESTHLAGERVCLYLREASKPGGRALLEGALPGELVSKVLVAHSEIVGTGERTSLKGFSDLRHKLETARKSSSKMNSLKTLNRLADVTDVHEADVTA